MSMHAISFPVRLGLCWSLLLMVLAGCVDPYTPDAISVAPSYLVVDGFINASGITEVKLSRTYNVKDFSSPPVTRATVAVEEEGGPRYLLREGAGGTYASSPLTLDRNRRYRLRINTSEGKDYASEFVPVKITPPIDSVTWRTTPDGVSIYVNSHDDTGASQYYRWDYEETWETSPVISPELEYVSATRSLQPITTPFPHLCWSTEKSTAISLFKTTTLSRDLVSNYPLRDLPTISERFFSKYSILVKQRAMTRPEYDYWDQLKKNTENIGTLFDPLPSQLTGNVRCLSNEDEPALGFIGAHSVTERRIFISRAQLPGGWRVQHGYESCLPVSTIDLAFVRDVPAFFQSQFGPGSNRVPVAYGTGGLLASTRECVDCRLRGTAVRPTFWQ